MAEIEVKEFRDLVNLGQVITYPFKIKLDDTTAQEYSATFEAEQKVYSDMLKPRQEVSYADMKKSYCGAMFDISKLKGGK